MTESTHSLAPASAPRLASSLDNKWEMTVSLSLTGETTEELWSLYRRAFDSLRTRAAQRHIMSRAEFDEQMSDERIDKIVVRDRTYDLRPACLSLMTNQLDAVSLVSADFYRKRWPEQYQDGRVWYVSFVAVAPEYQGTGVMATLIEHVCDVGGRLGGVFALDICDYNERSFGLPAEITRVGRQFNPGVEQKRLDAQVYWAYEIPAM